MSLLLKIHPETPSQRHILKTIEILRNGGVIIYPTDTVYGLGCDINNKKAVEKLARLKGIEITKANFSFICKDLSDISDYTKPLPTNIFKLMKRHLPGPFTFILPAGKNVPRIFENQKKTIGIRIPSNIIPVEIVRELGNPILTTSIHDTDEIIEYTTDPELIWERYKNTVDLIIDGGFGKNMASTVVDCTQQDPEIIRQGIGKLLL